MPECDSALCKPLHNSVAASREANRTVGLGASIVSPVADSSVGNPSRKGRAMRRYVLAFSLVSLTFAALAHDAAADLLAEVSVNGGPFVPICTNPSGSICSGSYSGGSLQLNMIAAQSNSPGTPTLALLLSSALSIMNTAASGTATAHLLIGDTGYRAPTGAATMLSHIGGSVAVGDPFNTMSFFSSIDQGNGQNVSPGTFNTAAVTPNISAAGSYDASNSAAIPLVSAPYSITENLTITLSAGSIMNYSSSTTVTPGLLSPVPEPMSLLLVGTSLIGLGLSLRHKRTANTQRRMSERSVQPTG